MGAEFRVACEFEDDCAVSPFEQADDLLLKLVKEGWEIFPSSEGLKAYCPNCTDRRRQSLRFEEHSRPIPGYPGYRALDSGDICVHKYIRCQHEWRVLRQCFISGGYLQVYVKSEHGGRSVPVHRLVCMAYHGLPEEGQVVDHINHIRSDNRPSNLRWVTKRENALHKSTPLGFYSRPLVGFDEMGNTVEFSGSTMAVQQYPRALAIAEKAEFEDGGYIFVDAEDWEKGICVGVEFEQMREAKLRHEQARRVYLEQLGVS